MYEELIKALEGCVDCFACTECPIHGSCNGTFDCAAHIAADHIKAQAAEIVSLTAQLAEYQEIGTPFGIKTILAKKDAPLAAKDAEIERLKVDNTAYDVGCRDGHDNSETSYTAQMDVYEDEIDGLKAALARVTAERDVALKALTDMRFAYINKDTDCPHQFETEALECADRLLAAWRTPAKQDEEVGG